MKIFKWFMDKCVEYRHRFCTAWGHFEIMYRKNNLNDFEFVCKGRKVKDNLEQKINFKGHFLKIQKSH